MTRALTAHLIAFALVLTGIAAVVADTRMAAAGVFCGPGGQMIVLDARGVPILDADGAAIAAPDCPACHVAHGLEVDATAYLPAQRNAARVAVPRPRTALLSTAPEAPRARAPPVWA